MGNRYPNLGQPDDDGFVNLTFKIADLAEDDQFYRFRLVALHNAQEVGMDVVMLKGMRAGFDHNVDLIHDHVYHDGVRFVRSGVESDRLIVAIQQLYEEHSEVDRMVEEERFTAIVLEQGELDFAVDCVRMKLFGKDQEPFDEHAYFESFFQIDLANRMAFWNEKDLDYRAPLLRAMVGR